MIKITVNCANVNEINKIIWDKKKAINDYERVRHDVMVSIKQLLTDTQKSFTARELSEKFGLPANIIARMAHDYGIRSRDHFESRKYVRLTDNGEVDFDDVQLVRYTCKEYYVYTC